MPNEIPDPQAVQLERRRQRAQEEIAKVVNKGRHPVFSLFKVTSTSGRTYQVQIRAIDQHLRLPRLPDQPAGNLQTC